MLAQPVPLAQYKAWESGAAIQRAMPQLMDEQREFFLTGATPEEWTAMFGDEKEEENAIKKAIKGGETVDGADLFIGGLRCEVK